MHQGIVNSSSGENLAVLLTAPGAAAIAVVRLSGSGVDSFLAQRFSKPVPIGRCVHGLLTDGDRTIDDALVVRCEINTIDLNVHGGAWVTQSVLNLAQADGFTISEDIALSVDGPTELWNQVLQALPMAKTEEAVRALLAQPDAWEKIADPAAVLADTSGQWLIRAPTVAIIGPPNVGKSTLANQLFGQTRSITADLPGTTRDWVGEIANIDGLAIMLIDTPGIRATADPIEHAAIAQSVEPIRLADLIIVVLDQSAPFDGELVTAYPSAVLVANKSDAALKWNADQIGAVRTVATIGIGVANLRRAIRHRFGWEPVDIHQPRWWTEHQCPRLAAIGT